MFSFPLVFLQKEDPLKRIQAEISEVERRERELREKKLLLIGSNNGFISPAHNASDSASSTDGAPSSMTSTSTDKDQNNDSVLSTMSDDSGISSSSSPINGQSSNRVAIPKYVRSFTLQNTVTPSTNSKMPLTRTMSTPQIYVPGTRLNFNSTTKGIMQRFIATHGRLPANGNVNKNGFGAGQNGHGNSNEETFINGKSNILVGLFMKYLLSKDKFEALNIILLQSLMPCSGTAISQLKLRFFFFKQTSAELNRAPIFLLPTEIVSPPKIERDETGRPVRRGFVPVEEKIQKELRDLRSRESELKRLRKEHQLRQSQPDLLNSLTNSPE